MSGTLQTPAATLEGWEGPFYPAGITELADELHGCRYNRHELDHYAMPAAEFCAGFQPSAAADGYQWFWLLRYARGGREFLLAIPSVHGSVPRDRCVLDRSPAIYARRYDEAIAVEIVAGLVRSMRTADPPDYSD